MASAGSPFLIAALASRNALRRCVLILAAFNEVLQLDGAVSIYVYIRDVDPDECDLQARRSCYGSRGSGDEQCNGDDCCVAHIDARFVASVSVSATGRGHWASKLATYAC